MPSFYVGQVVFAKVKYCPFLPGRVIDPPKSLKKPLKKECVCVSFFGKEDYCFVETKNVKSYLDHKRYMKEYKHPAWIKCIKAAEEYFKDNKNDLSELSRTPKDGQLLSALDASQHCRKDLYEYPTSLRTKEKVIFAGSGDMNKIIIRLLNAAKYTVFALDQNEGSANLEHVFENNIVFSCQENADAVVTSLFHNEGLLKGISKGKGLVEMTGVYFDLSVRVMREVRVRGGQYLEVVMVGSRANLVDGTSAIFCGGDLPLYEEVRDVLKAISKNVTYVGPVGLASNIAVIMRASQGLVIGAITEGITAAEQLGLDLDLLKEILLQSPIQCPLAEHTFQSVMNRNFSDALVSVQDLRQDLTFLVKVADEDNLPLHVTNALRELSKRALLKGYTMEDVSAAYLTMATHPKTS